jgi:hypothetical protein
MVERRFDANGTVGHDVITGALSKFPIQISRFNDVIRFTLIADPR